MSCQGLYTVSDVSKLIEKGRVLLVAGNEVLLSQLPKGTWIGGTSTNFMATAGGLTARDMVFVSDITDQVERAEVRSYSVSELPHIAADYPKGGFTVLNVPAFSELHSKFAKEVSTYDGIFNSPLYGWISGVDVSEIGKRSPKTFAGDGTPRTEEAVALHVTLPAGKVAKIDIINLFAQGAGAEIEFAADGFETSGDCQIGGKAGESCFLRCRQQDRRQAAASRGLSGRDGERIAARRRRRGRKSDVLCTRVQGRQIQVCGASCGLHRGVHASDHDD